MKKPKPTITPIIISDDNLELNKKYGGKNRVFSILYW
jgi:hypothetical protein